MPLGLSFASLSFWNWKLSRNAKLLLSLLAGLSLSILATGYLLSKRRRRYRAISTTSSDHASSFRRTSTFRTNENPTPFHSMTQSRHVGLSAQFPSPLSPDSNSSHSVSEAPILKEEEEDIFTNIVPYSHSDDFSDGAGHGSTQLSSRLSESSDDSFHSTVDYIDNSTGPLQRNHFYLTAMEQVKHGLVHCRKLRTKMLMCKSDADFLAKLFCIRLAFDELMESQANRNYFKQTGRDIMSSFLRSTNQDPALFCERYDSLNQFLEQEENWTVAERELRDRKVVCMNVYDIAMDFVLLDAFNDLDNPPSTIVAVLQNRWITDGMKQSALSAAIWSLLKAKKSMLRSKGGFMAHFYLLSETISPTLAWGFLGTNTILREQCLQFRAHVLEFMCDIFSLDSVRYTTVHMLADDILLLAQHTAQSLIVE